MRKILFLLLFLGPSANAQFDSEGLREHNVTVNDESYLGRDSVRVVQSDQSVSEDKLAILKGIDFTNGSIEGYIVGELQHDAAQAARGFVGIAFRVDEKVESFEAIYLRPTNARSNDQLRRNHSVQYFSFPEYPWHRLRREHPGQYETYVDMALGEWIHYRVEVDGDVARLFINHAEFPSFIVNDLKLGEKRGQVALWVGPGTLARFSGLVVTSD